MNLLREKARARGQHRLCFGGDSDASQTTLQTDRRVTGGHGSANTSGDGNTVTTVATDHGAVLSGAEIARGAVLLAGGALASNEVNTRNALSLADTSVRQVTEAARGAIEQSGKVQASALSSMEDVFSRALTNTKDTFSGALGQVEDAYSTAKAGDQKIVSMVALAVVGMAAIFIFGKAR